MKHIASTAFGDVYEKGEVLAKQYEQFFGRGIFNVNGGIYKYIVIYLFLL